MLPFGGDRENGSHKGYAFAAIVDIMCSMLGGGQAGFLGGSGHYFAAYDIDSFSDKEKFKNKDINRPLNWSGFIVRPQLIEFWQDMPFRLHDRLEYKKINDEWFSMKLFP